MSCARSTADGMGTPAPVMPTEMPTDGGDSGDGEMLCYLVITRPVTFLPFRLDSPDVCTGGIPGIESSDGSACCLAECGQCGGSGCSTVGDASDCCVNDIISSGDLCSETGTAPCSYAEPTAPTPTATDQPVSPTEPMPMPPTSGGDEPEGTDVHTFVGCYDADGVDLADEFDFADATEDDNMVPSVSIGTRHPRRSPHVGSLLPPVFPLSTC